MTSYVYFHSIGRKMVWLLFKLRVFNGKITLIAEINIIVIFMGSIRKILTVKMKSRVVPTFWYKDNTVKEIQLKCLKILGNTLYPNAPILRTPN